MDPVVDAAWHDFFVAETGILASFAVALVNAWVLLVEILR
jgi:hypothetical protein